MESKVIELFRQDFFSARRAKISKFGVMTFDESSLLCALGENAQPVVVSDLFPAERAHGKIEHYLLGLEHLWTARCHQTQEKHPEPHIGLFARFLPHSGFDYVVEFQGTSQKPTMAWRVDSRGRAAQLPLPENDGDFRDQTGGFLDLRFGWGWLAERYAAEKQTVVAEAESGYLMGIRSATAENADPLQREDDIVDELMSRYGRAQFDCFEHLNSPESQQLPFEHELFAAQLSEQFSTRTPIEIFVLADSNAFYQAVLEFADQVDVSVNRSVRNEEEGLHIVHGEVEHWISFSYPFLRTLHSGRGFFDGVRDFVLPSLQKVADASSLLAQMKVAAPECKFSKADAGIVTVTLESTDSGQTVDLFQLSGQLWLKDEDLTRLLRRLFKLDVQQEQPVSEQAAVNPCLLCEAETRVGKLVRPRPANQDARHRFVGIETDRHFIYFTRECSQHSVPIELDAQTDLEALELEYQEGLATSVSSLIHVETVDPGIGWTFVGPDIGSLIIEPARVRTLANFVGMDQNRVWGCCYFADSLTLLASKPNAELNRRLRQNAFEFVQPIFSERLWNIDLIRAFDLDEEPVGLIEDISPQVSDGRSVIKQNISTHQKYSIKGSTKH